MNINTSSYLFLAMGVFLIIVGYNIQVGWLFLIASILFISIIINLVYPLLLIRRVIVSRSVNNVFEDEDATVTVTITNLNSFALHMLNIIDYFPTAEKQQEKNTATLFYPKISPYKTEIMSYSRRATIRGKYIFQPVIIESSAPFGLIKYQRKFHLPTLFTVYPKPLHILKPEFERANDLYAATQLLMKGSGYSDDFWGLREYAPGDSLRFVHWRTSAKEQKLMIKEFRRTSGANFVFILDTTSNKHKGNKKTSSLEYSIKIAAALIDNCIKQATEVELYTNDGTPPMKTMSIWNILSHLASIKHIDNQQPSNETSYKTIENIMQSVTYQKTHQSNIIIILPVDSKGISSQLLHLLMILKQRFIAVTIIALLAESFNAPYTPLQPNSIIDDGLSNSVHNILWVTRDKEKVYTI